jgi:hypothetical protein
MTNEKQNSDQGQAAAQPALSKGSAVVIGAAVTMLAGTLAFFTAVGSMLFQGAQQMNIPAETVKKLSPQIVDPNVSAARLEQQGFYKVNYGGAFLDECRVNVLTSDFNKDASMEAKADKISNCIKTHIMTLSSPGHYN